MSSSNCCFLTCIQISQETDQVVWYSHLLKNFPQFIVIHTVKGFGILNKAEIDVFLELSYFFHDPVDVGNLISGSSAFSKTSLNIWKFTVHILLKPVLIQAYNLSSPAFLMICSAYRLNKQGDNRQPCRTHFFILNQSVVPYRVLTVASWPTYRLLRRQVRWSGIPISLRAFYSLSYTVRGFSIVDETKINVFPKFPYFLYNPVNWQFDL